MIGRIRHQLAHRFGWFYGYCESFWQGDTLMMSFVCSSCGLRTGVHQIGMRG